MLGSIVIVDTCRRSRNFFSISVSGSSFVVVFFLLIVDFFFFFFVVKNPLVQPDFSCFSLGLVVVAAVDSVDEDEDDCLFFFFRLSFFAVVELLSRNPRCSVVVMTTATVLLGFLKWSNGTMYKYSTIDGLVTSQKKECFE